VESIIRFDMRGPSFGAPMPHLYQAALEMADYADQRGVDVILLTEHHGSDDGYCPAPTVLAGAVAARSRRARIRLAVVILPLHHPVSVAEQTLVLDQISNGRVDLVVGAGYVAGEFAMFGRTLKQRAALLDDGIPLIAAALAGEEVRVGDHSFTVTPRAVQNPRPPFYVAGGVAASARRAARYADGFFPLIPDAEIRELYRAECQAMDREPGVILNVPTALFVHIADDPERTWDQLGRHVFHDLNSYGRWSTEAVVGDLRTPFAPVDDLAAARASGLYKVVTVDECVTLMNQLDSVGHPIMLTPLLAGIDPDIAWPSVELFFERVLPTFREQVRSARVSASSAAACG
jgi:alkanesulfonate monooxygenase SsuD/methylene tetrahydromethanopterin reductase-like flavin-dependent oxidoreductase (luciferase family)